MCGRYYLDDEAIREIQGLVGKENIDQNPAEDGIFIRWTWELYCGVKESIWKQDGCVGDFLENRVQIF